MSFSTRPWKTIAITVLLLACVFNFTLSPYVLCLMNSKCTHESFFMVAMYPRMIAMACFVSCAVSAYRYRGSIRVYEKNVEAHEMYSPTTAAERRSHSTFYRVYVFSGLLVIVSANLARITITYTSFPGKIVPVFYASIYLENVYMFLAEAYFVKLCYALDKMFYKINTDLERMGEEFADPTLGGRRVSYGSDFYGGSKERSAANAVEIIRIRHRLTRDAVSMLIDLFGIPMGMSLLNLWVLTLFEIYYQVFSVMGSNTKPIIMVIAYILQYVLRFYAIITISHNMTKQGFKSKILITNINNRYLDKNTKEELKLFLNQISSCAIEITACGLTFNTNLITSAFATGMTYLIILIQFKG